MTSQPSWLGAAALSSWRRLGIRLSTVTFSVALFLCSCAQDALPPLQFESVYMEALAPQQDSAAVFMRIRNNSSVAQSLNYAHSPVAGHIEIHRSMYDQGQRKMRRMQRLTIAPGKTENLSSQAYHLMLEGIYDSLAAGDSFELTMEFDSGEVAVVQVEVRPRG